MLISTKNKKSSIIKGITLLIACVMLFTLVLTSCNGSDALEAAKKAQVAADLAKTAADAAKEAAENAVKEAEDAKKEAEAARDTAKLASTSEQVAKAIQAQIALITDQLKDYSKTADVNTLIQAKLTEALGTYFTKTQVTTEIQAQLVKYMLSTDVTAAIATVNSKFADYSTSAQVATAITTAITEKLADYMTKAEISTEIQTQITQSLASFTVDEDIADAFADFIDEYNTASDIAVDTYLKIDVAINDLLTNPTLYPSTSLLNTVKALTSAKLYVMRALTVADAQAITDAADATIADCKSYPQIAYEAFLAVDEFIYPIVDGTAEQNPYDSQKQMDAYLAAITINTGDAGRDATIMAAINSYVVDETTTLDLKAKYYEYDADWVAVNKFGDVTAAQLLAAIEAIDDEFATITLDQTAKYVEFKNDVDAADAIYADAKTAIGADNVNFTRLITTLQKLKDAIKYRDELKDLATEPSEFIDKIDVLLGSTGWTANGKVLFSTYKTADAEDGSITLLKADVESWATTNNIPAENISTLITNYDALVSAYDYAKVQHDAYVAFTADVKPAIESANAATLALSNEALFTEAKTKLTAWLAAGVDDINISAIYTDTMKTTFVAGLARIAELNAAKAAAVDINDYISTFAPPAVITIHTKTTLTAYWETTIRDIWCATYNIPHSEADTKYIAENYALVNVAELNGYANESQALIDAVIVKGQDFVNAVKAIDGYDLVAGNHQATLYSYAKINAAIALYNNWSDENLITDPAFSGLATEVANHYAIWTLLASQYNALEAQAIIDFTTPASAIDLIGAVNIYSASVINAAQTAYDTWMTKYLAKGTTSEDLKASIVTMVNAKLTVLETSKTAFNALKVAKDAETANVITLINAIPTPVTTASFDAIVAARAAYEAWLVNIDITKDDYVVTNYAALVAAEASMNSIKALATTANASIDALKALTLAPATEATTNEYKDAIAKAKADSAAFVTANGEENDYTYVSEAQIAAIATADENYDKYLFQVEKDAALAKLKAEYDTVCADPLNVTFIPQLTISYNQQIDRINAVERTETYNGLDAYGEMNRLVDEFKFLVDSIIKL